LIRISSGVELVGPSVRPSV